MVMFNPIRITYRHLTASSELTDLVHDEAARLMSRRPPVTSIRVALSRPHRSRRNGTPVRVRIELAVPGRPVVVRARHEDPRAAVHEAFDAAERALRSYRSRRRSARQRMWWPWTRPLQSA